MVTWLDSLRPASFRGVEFHIDTAEKSFGPRVITHEFPLRDTPYHEFLGRLPQSITVEAVLIGDDLMDQVARLEAALDEPAPGRLVHPWYGELDVVVAGEVVTRVSTREGRIARIEAKFQRAGDIPSPTAAPDTSGRAAVSADTARETLISEFGDDWTLSGAPDFALAGVLEAANTLLATAAQGLQQAGLVWPPLVLSAIDLLAPRQLARSIMQSHRAAAGLQEPTPWRRPAPAAARTAAQALLPLAAPAPAPEPKAATPSRRLQAARTAQLATLTRSAAVITAAEVAAVMPPGDWVTREEALRFRDDFAAAADSAADAAAEHGWDATWRAISDMRGAVLRDLTERSAPLPRLSTMRPATPTSSVVLAHQLDGDRLDDLFTRASDIARRNRLRHPGFAPADELEVIGG